MIKISELCYAVQPIQGNESFNWMYDNNSLSFGTFLSGIRKALDYDHEDFMKPTVWKWIENRNAAPGPVYSPEYEKLNFQEVVMILYHLYNTNNDGVLTMKEASD